MVPSQLAGAAGARRVSSVPPYSGSGRPASCPPRRRQAATQGRAGAATFCSLDSLASSEVFLLVALQCQKPNVLSNVRRSTSTLAQSSSMLRAPLPATSRPQSRLAAARQQHTARLHCAGRATGADRRRQPSTVRAAVCGLLAVLLTLGKLGAAATALTAGQPAAIVAAAPARWRIVAPTSPRGEVTGPACANRTLCAVPHALMATTTRGGLGSSRSSPGPAGAYPVHSQQGHTIPVPRDSLPRVARYNLAKQLLMAAGPLLWLFGSIALLGSVARRLPATPQPAAAIPVGTPELSLCMAALLLPRLFALTLHPALPGAHTYSYVLSRDLFSRETALLLPPIARRRRISALKRARRHARRRAEGSAKVSQCPPTAMSRPTPHVWSQPQTDPVTHAPPPHSDSLPAEAPRGASAGRLSLCGGGACVTGSVCGWDHTCGVGRLIAVGGHWDTFALPSARLRACLRARLRALMRRLRAIGGSRSAVSRENKSRERT